MLPRWNLRAVGSIPFMLVRLSVLRALRLLRFRFFHPVAEQLPYFFHFTSPSLRRQAKALYPLTLWSSCHRLFCGAGCACLGLSGLDRRNSQTTVWTNTYINNISFFRVVVHSPDPGQVYIQRFLDALYLSPPNLDFYNHLITIILSYNYPFIPLAICRLLNQNRNLVTIYFIFVTKFQFQNYK